MPAKARLAPIADLASHRQRLAEKALADAQRQVAGRREMLAQLSRFRDDYDTAQQRAEVGARSVAALRDFEHFLARLDQAVHQQRRELTEAQAVSTQLRTALRDATARAEGLKLVLERAADLERRRDDAREQRLLDELASFAYLRR
ncbi:MAG: flagellar export protein FliJ [Pseudomonadota bacterium]